MKRSICVVSAGCTLVFGLATLAGPPELDTTFNYQGQVALLGRPLNNRADFTFSLWDAASGGNQLGPTLTRGNIEIVDGLFTVNLNFGNAPFSGADRWLEIGIRNPHDPSDSAPFETLSPRQRITASPYSLHTRGVFVTGSGDVGIGTTAPQSRLHIAGNTPEVRLEHDGSPESDGIVRNIPATLSIDKAHDAGNSIIDLNPLPADGSGNALVRTFRDTVTTGTRAFQVLRGDGSASVSAQMGADGVDSFVQSDGGNFGIGTSTPDTTLSILTPGNTREVGVTQDNIGGSTSGQASNLGTLDLTTEDSSGNQTTRMRIFPDQGTVEFWRGQKGTEARSVQIDGVLGHVGIGTQIDTTPLALRGNGGTNNVGITQNQVGGVSTMELTTTDGGNHQATRLVLRGGSDNPDVAFYRGARGAESATVAIDGSNGYLGIGTEAPATPLSLRGNGGSSNVGVTQNQVGDSSSMELTTADGSGQQATRLLLHGGTNGGGLEVHRGARGAEQLSMFVNGANGRVGIGTSSPATLLDVDGTATVNTLRFTDGSTQTTAANGWITDFGFAAGIASAPNSTHRFVVPTVTITVGQNEQVFVSSHRVFGTTNAGGADQLALNICYRAAGSSASPTNAAILGLGPLSVPANTSVPMGMSAIIDILTPGNYEVGLCGSVSGATNNWNNNEGAFTTALVFKEP